MNKIFYITLFITSLCAGRIMAQDKGSVSVHADPRLALLISKSKPVERPAEFRAPVATVKKEIAKKPEGKIPTSRMEAVKREANEFVAERNIPVKATGNKPSADDVKAMRRAGMKGSTIPASYHGTGYRVQIYNGTNRNEALRIKAEFMRNYPGVRTYFSFTTPNYRVKVGNFRRREDATGLFREANDTYRPCMIVPDVVGIN